MEELLKRYNEISYDISRFEKKRENIIKIEQKREIEEKVKKGEKISFEQLINYSKNMSLQDLLIYLKCERLKIERQLIAFEKTFNIAIKRYNEGE